MTDKRTLFPFGANTAAGILDLLAGMGVELRIEGEKLNARTMGPVPERAAKLIKENRDMLYQHLRDEDEQKKADALAKLPPVEFDQGEAVVMREAVLLKLPDGSYLALTPEEVSTLDGFVAVAKNDSTSGKNTVVPTPSMNAGIDCSKSFQESHTLKELF